MQGSRGLEFIQRFDEGPHSYDIVMVEPTKLRLHHDMWEESKKLLLALATATRAAVRQCR
jgi:hypothetical protein